MNRLVDKLDRFFSVQFSQKNYIILQIVIFFLGLLFYSIEDMVATRNEIWYEIEKGFWVGKLNLIVCMSILLMRLSRKFKLLFTPFVAYNCYTWSLTMLNIVDIIVDGDDNDHDWFIDGFCSSWCIINVFVLYLLFCRVKVKGIETKLEDDIVKIFTQERQD